MSEVFLPPVEQLVNVDLFNSLQETDVGQFGPDYTNLERFKQAGEYALEAQIYANYTKKYGESLYQRILTLLESSGDRSTLVELSLPSGASKIGTSSGNSIQESLDKMPVYASLYGFSLTEDSTDLWKSFLQEPVDKVVDMDIYISGIGDLFPGTTLRGSKGATIYITKNIPTTGDNQGQCINAGNFSNIVSLKIDGQGFSGAGVAVLSKQNVLVQKCNFTNSNCIGIRDYKSTDCFYSKNIISRSKHGIQCWLSKNVRAESNLIYQIGWTSGNNGGGIFTSSATNVLVYGNIIYDCNDVGVDFEGGNFCTSDSNIVSRCKNGELAIFPTGQESELINSGIVMGNLLHQNNVITRTGFCYNKDGEKVTTSLTDIGALMVYGGLDLVQEGSITFKNNTVRVLANPDTSMRAFSSRTSNVLSNARIEFLNNNVVSKAVSPMITLMDRQDLIIKGNYFRWENSVVSGRSEIKDHRSELIQGNYFDFSDTSSFSGQNILFLNTSITVTGRSIVEGNSFTGINANWLLVNQSVSNRRVKISNNNFLSSNGSGFSVDPILVTAGEIEYQNQKIDFSLGDDEVIDFSSKSMFKMARYDGTGTFYVSMGGSYGPKYPFDFKNVTSSLTSSPTISPRTTQGAINTGIYPNSARYATFLNSTIRAVDTQASIPNRSKCSVILDYMI